VFPYIALFRLTSEGSTPFLNVRWVLVTLNKKNTKLYIYNGFALLFAFFCVRILTIVPNWYAFFSLINTPEFASIELKYKVICVLSCIPLDCLNLFWFSKMLRMARRSLNILINGKLEDLGASKRPVHVTPTPVINTETISDRLNNDSIEKKIS
jgi:hypothetical protein